MYTTCSSSVHCILVRWVLRLGLDLDFLHTSNMLLLLFVDSVSQLSQWHTSSSFSELLLSDEQTLSDSVLKELDGHSETAGRWVSSGSEQLSDEMLELELEEDESEDDEDEELLLSEHFVLELLQLPLSEDESDEELQNEQSDMELQLLLDVILQLLSDVIQQLLLVLLSEHCLSTIVSI